MVVVRDSDSPEGLTHSPRWIGEVVLLQRLGPHSWTVRPSGRGTIGVGRSIALGVARDADPAELADRAAELIGPGLDSVSAPGPGLVPVLGLGAHRRRVWLVSERTAGLDVRRLVDVVKPSADQAAVLAADLLSTLSALHSRGGAHGRVHPGNVLLGADGATRLTDWATGWTRPAPDGPAGTGWREARRADVAAAGAVTAVVARAARCPAGNPTAAGRMLANLPRLLSSSPPAERVEEMVAELYATIGDQVRTDDVRDELAVLVDAATHRRRRPPRPASRPAIPDVLDLTDGSDLSDRSDLTGGADLTGSVDLTGSAAPPAPPDPPLSGPAGGPWPGPPRSRPALARAARSVWGLAAALAVLGLVVGLEVTFLHRPIASDLRALRGSPAAPATTSTPAAPVVSVAPSAPVRAVDLRAMAPCAAGHPCLVRILVDLVPQPGPLHLAWSLDATDRCGKGSVSLSARSQTVAAHTAQVVDLQSVDLPAWRALNLVLRTVTPVPATATPVPVPASGGTC